MGLSTHILDTSLGRPAPGVDLMLRIQQGANWSLVGTGHTDADGRCRTLLGERELEEATYQLRFETGAYFASQHLATLYPFVEISFVVMNRAEHHHIPLLISPNGYTTYRGS